jgi:TonB family protein
MLMSIYLEAGNYARAEALLEENFSSRSTQSAGSYFALAGQGVNGARTHLARYRGLGINTSASNLPPEAIKDLDRLRSFLERMIVHAKEIISERKAYDSLSLLEDVLGIRLSLARDSDEQAKWSGEYSGARQLLASQTQITSPNGISPLPPGKAPAIKAPSPYSSRRTPEMVDAKATEKSNHSAPTQPSSDPAANGSSAPSDEKLTDFGLLNFKASKRVLPRYPPLAKQSGTTGLVRVHVIVDETGKVVSVSRTEGPMLLRKVAEDAAREWFFEGLTGSGQASPTGRFTGYIDFNFTL